MILQVDPRGRCLKHAAPWLGTPSLRGGQNGLAGEIRGGWKGQIWVRGRVAQREIYDADHAV